MVLWRQLLCDPLTFKIKQTEVEPVNNGALRNFSRLLSYGLQSPVSPCLLAAVPWAVKGSLPEAAQPAERWCNSPGPGGGGHWAWLPLWPCASPPTAVSRWLLPAPETPPFPGNAAVTNRGTWQSGTRQIGRSSKFKSFIKGISYFVVFKDFSHSNILTNSACFMGSPPFPCFSSPDLISQCKSLFYMVTENWFD